MVWQILVDNKDRELICHNDFANNPKYSPCERHDCNWDWWTIPQPHWVDRLPNKSHRKIGRDHSPTLDQDDVVVVVVAVVGDGNTMVVVVVVWCTGVGAIAIVVECTRSPHEQY